MTPITHATCLRYITSKKRKFFMYVDLTDSEAAIHTFHVPHLIYCNPRRIVMDQHPLRKSIEREKMKFLTSLNLVISAFWL